MVRIKKILTFLLALCVSLGSIAAFCYLDMRVKFKKEIYTYLESINYSALIVKIQEYSIYPDIPEHFGTGTFEDYVYNQCQFKEITWRYFLANASKYNKYYSEYMQDVQGQVMTAIDEACDYVLELESKYHIENINYDGSVESNKLLQDSKASPTEMTAVQ